MDKLDRVILHIEEIFKSKNIKIAPKVDYRYRVSWDEGFYISMTKTRFKNIEKELKESFVTIDKKHHFFKDFSYKLLKIVSKSTPTSLRR